MGKIIKDTIYANIAVARETRKIIWERKYVVDGKEVYLPGLDLDTVTVISPKDGEFLLRGHLPMDEADGKNITIVAEDSFQAAKRFTNPMVMNFANAHKPGGGFELGATAQEEALCRCSTLIASIGSEKAKEMYHYNNTHFSSVESDYMLLSKVMVFRNEKNELIPAPFEVGVVTVPAPNRIGLAALTPVRRIDEVMERRIRILLLAARNHGYRSVILGAWGCGAFHNAPRHVAKCFHTVLLKEGYASYFDNICFAIYGKEDSRNITEFRARFQR